MLSIAEVFTELNNRHPLSHKDEVCSLYEGFVENNNVKTFLNRLAFHDEATFIHSLDVFYLFYIFGPKDQDLLRGALLHDIGKLEVDKCILQKPSKLTSEEILIMNTHTTKGYEILTDLNFHSEAELALKHHERMGGEGYPNGLTVSSLRDVDMLLSAIDVFSALSLNRPYKRALSFDETFALMKQEKGLNHHYIDVLENHFAKKVF
jgi:HD-GYP domain-containing protein (c-di-GMP phosphodiesterase class II)